MIEFDIIKNEDDVNKIITDNHKIVSKEVDRITFSEAIVGNILIAGWINFRPIYGEITATNRYPRDKYVMSSGGRVDNSIDFTYNIVFKLLVERGLIFWEPENNVLKEE